MKFKFIVKPPLTQDLEREILNFKKDFEIDIELTEKTGKKNAKNLAKKAIEDGFERIVFVGGDGLLGEGINGIMEVREKIPENFVIGILPTGSGNNFAKALKIPKDIKKAAEIIKRGKEIFVDVGKVNNFYFINCFSLGLDAEVNDLANKIKDKIKFLPRDLGYLFSAIYYLLFKFRFFDLTLEGKEIIKEGKMILVAITNSQSYGGFFKINPGAKISDGFLNLCFILPMGRLKAFFSLFKLIRGTHIFLPEVKTLKISSLKIFSKEKILWEIDGEVKEPQKFFEIEIFPKALKFFANL